MLNSPTVSEHSLPFAVLDAPDTGRAVIACRNDPPAVRGKGGLFNLAGVLERGQQLSVVSLPYLHRSVIAHSEKVLAVIGERRLLRCAVRTDGGQQLVAAGSQRPVQIVLRGRITSGRRLLPPLLCQLVVRCPALTLVVEDSKVVHGSRFSATCRLGIPFAGS